MKKTARLSGGMCRILFLASLVLLCVCIACQQKKEGTDPTSGNKEPSKTRTITFYDGQSITVPQHISRIASGWNAQNSIIAMLGYGDKIVATTQIIRSSPVFGKFVPGIKDAVVCFLSSGELNNEGLLRVKPELVFIPAGSGIQHADRFERLGIPVAPLKCNSMKNIVDRVLITGQILGDDAYEIARHYVDYYNANVKRVTDRVVGIPMEKRVKVYHCMGNTLMTASGHSLVQDWMDLAGVINIAGDWNISARKMRSQSNANLEQIIAANPDIIVSMGASEVHAIMTSPAWCSINAIKSGAVYVNPRGMFFWCRETSEEALQFLWLAKIAYPEQFADIDMARETKYFYKTFYGYDLSDEDVDLFLSPGGINPAVSTD